jgi:hypothetical protein
MKTLLVACFAAVVFLSILFMGQGYIETTVLSSPGNVYKQLHVCDGQSIADAIADHLLSEGIHDANFEPIRSDFDNLYLYLCGPTVAESAEVSQRCESSSRTPSAFRSEKHKFTSVNFRDPADMTDFVRYPVYLREGYSAEQLGECVCAQHGCDQQAQEAVVQYLSGVISGL